MQVKLLFEFFLTGIMCMLIYPTAPFTAYKTLTGTRLTRLLSKSSISSTQRYLWYKSAQSMAALCNRNPTGTTALKHFIHIQNTDRYIKQKVLSKNMFCHYNYWTEKKWGLIRKTLKEIYLFSDEFKSKRSEANMLVWIEKLNLKLSTIWESLSMPKTHFSVDNRQRRSNVIDWKDPKYTYLKCFNDKQLIWFHVQY